MIPLFPELRPYLEAVFDAAEPGTTYVISQHRLASANLRTQLLRIMDRAGVKRVAPAVSKHAGKPGDGTNAAASPARRYGVDRQFGPDRSPALSPGHRHRL